jgi:hypothetical protein
MLYYNTIVFVRDVPALIRKMILLTVYMPWNFINWLAKKWETTVNLRFPIYTYFSLFSAVTRIVEAVYVVIFPDMVHV